MAQYGWKYSLGKCTGCHSCTIACRMEQNWPEKVRFRWVTQKDSGSYPDISRSFFSSACYHCEEPACMNACDLAGVGAISRDPTFGAIIIDKDLCIGCKHCIYVCPYGAPQWNEDLGVADKCDFCVHRLEAGMNPACVDTCVGNALRLDTEAEGPVNTTDAEDVGFPNPDMTGPNIEFD